jgi:uncharacterized membrane protein YdjX (TVP38/TMEM64 family)
MPRPAASRILAFAGFPLLLAAIAVPVILFRGEIWRLATDVPALRAWVEASGPVAPLIFAAIQAVQVIVFIIPGEVPQIVGGLLFGTWAGTLLSIGGILAGSTVTFFLSRLLGVPFVHALFRREQVERLDRLLGSRNSRVLFFLLFLIPGIPKDILCYVGGISPMPFPVFLLASLGRLPGIVVSALLGNAAGERKWLLVGILGGAAVLLFVAGLLLRGRIEKWLEAVAARRRGPGEPPREG